jgi:hypothetical protein
MIQKTRRKTDIDDIEIDELIKKEGASAEVKAFGLIVKKVVSVLHEIAGTLQDQHEGYLLHQHEITNELRRIADRFAAHEEKDAEEHFASMVELAKAKTSYRLWVKIFTGISLVATGIVGAVWNEYKQANDNFKELDRRITVNETLLTGYENRFIDFQQQLTEKRVDSIDSDVGHIKRKRAIIYSK